MANVYKSFGGQPTRKDMELAITKQAIQNVSDMVHRDPQMLLEVVAGGPDHWRRNFLSAFRGHRGVDSGIADLLFLGFRERLISFYGGEDAAQTAMLALDKLEVTTPPTQKEIDDAWEVESASSEDGRQSMYGGLHPQEWLQRQLH
jgi:hypothetical protein